MTGFSARGGACVLATALLLNAANEPFGLGLLAFFALVPLFFCFDRNWKQRFLIGWAAGFLVQALGYYWIFYTIRDFGGLNPFLSALGGLLFWLYQGLDLALWLLLAPAVGARLPAWARPFAAAAVWLVLQQGVMPYIFPWAYASAFTSFLPVSRGAVFWGAHGLGFLALLVQGMMACYPGRAGGSGALAALKRLVVKQRIRESWLIAALPILMMAPALIPLPAPVESWRVAVVQPNLIPWAKQGQLSADELFQAHYQPSLSLLDRHPDLIVWPETALPFDLSNATYYRNQIHELADRGHCAVILGTVEFPEERHLRNAIWMFSPGSRDIQKYAKEKRVLFAEELPWILSWATLFDPNLGGFLPGQENRPFHYRDRLLVPLVCFEALFPGFTGRHDGNLLVNLTNDAWFGKTKASRQHLQQIQQRAVENRVPLVRATNSGISCWVDASGRVPDAGGLYTKASYLHDIPVPTRPPARYSHWGEYLLRGLSYAFLAWGILAALRKRKPTT